MVDILRASDPLELLFARDEERFVFSVRVEDVQLGQDSAASRPRSGVAGWRAGVAALAGGFAGTLLPDTCRICDLPLTGLSTLPVCAECRGKILPQTLESPDSLLCNMCGGARGMESARFEQAMGEVHCATCRRVPPPFTRASAFGLYGGELRELLHLLKYGGHRRIGERLLAPLLVETVGGFRPDMKLDARVVAVPLFAGRARERRFNQAELLANAMIRRLRRKDTRWQLRPAHAALERVVNTHELYHLKPRQRRVALKGAFRMRRPELVRGHDVLLIDDILTTGATARECARVLLAGGAARVFVATVARAQEEVQVARWNATAVQGFGAT